MNRFVLVIVAIFAACSPAIGAERCSGLCRLQAVRPDNVATKAKKVAKRVILPRENVASESSACRGGSCGK